MKSWYSCWWTSLSASVTFFVGQRLDALGKIIAHDLERSYVGWLDNVNSQGRELPKISTGIDLPVKNGRRNLHS
jgi:hypothetical protein